jgi:hypothetical protein
MFTLFWYEYKVQIYLSQTLLGFQSKSSQKQPIFTLESGIDVAPGINVAPGTLVKNNTRSPLNKHSPPYK